MQIAKLLWTLFLTAFLMQPAYAANQTTEIWQITWDGGRCELVLNYSTDDMAGTATPKNCSKALRKVRSFVYTDDDQREMILFRRNNAQGAILGQFDKSGRNEMEGLIGDGEPAEMFLASKTSTTLNVNTGGNAGSNADCVTYTSGGCARKSDLNNPDIRFGDPIEMEMLANAKIYPFSGGRGFPKDEKAARGQCLSVKKCEQAFSSDDHWCEVVLSDGFFTGWVLRKDDDTVYLRKGC